MAQTKAQLLGPVVGDVTIDTNTLSLDSENNKVGIGTASATNKLHVKDTFNIAYSLTNVADEANHILKLENASTTANAFSGMQFRVGSGADLFFGAIQQTINHGDFFFANQNSPQKEMMRIKSTGNVGIGTNDPAVLLHLESTAANAARLRIGFDSPRYYDIFRGSTTNSGYLNFYGSQSSFVGYTFGGVDGEWMRIKNNGFVGVGTDNPGAPLHVLSSAYPTATIQRDHAVNYPRLRLINTANDGADLDGIGDGTGGFRISTVDAGTSTERLRINSTGKVRVGSGSAAYNLEIYGSGAQELMIGSSNASSAGIILDGDSNGDGSGGDYAQIFHHTDGTLNFRSRNGSGGTDTIFYSNTSETLRIKSNGNVGIGTQEPDLKLHINGANALPSSSGSTATGYLTLRNKAGSSSHGMFMGVSNAAPWSSWIQAQDASNNATSYPLLLNPNGGNVGIGNDNPTVALDVKKATAGTIGRFYDIGSNGDALYNGGPIVALSRISNGNVSLDGLLFQVGIDKSNSLSYNIDETVFCVGNRGVGIGEDDPQVNLHLSKSLGTTSSYKDAQMIRIAGTSNANQMAGIGFSYYTTNPSTSAYPSVWIGAKVSSWTAYVKHDLVFATRGTDTNVEPTERFRITEGGELQQNYDLRYRQQGYFTTATSAHNNTNSPTLATTLSYSFGYQDGFSSSNGTWAFPYPKLIVGYHTGINFGGHRNYYGCRFFEDHPSNNSNIVLSVGNQSTGVHVTNTLTAGTKTFRIVHPHPSKKYTHDLVHSVIEGPQCDNIYRGKVDLVNGTASINIDTVSNMTDGTFVLLNRDIQCFTSNETGWTAVKGSVSGNILTITAKSSSCTDTISWMVIGERQDDKIKSPEIEITDSDGKLIIEPLTIEQTHM